MKRSVGLLGLCALVAVAGCTETKAPPSSQRILYRFVCPTYAPLRGEAKVEGNLEASGSGIVLRTRSGSSFKVDSDASVYLMGGPIASPMDPHSRACQTTHRQSIGTLGPGAYVTAGITGNRVRWLIGSIP